MKRAPLRKKGKQSISLIQRKLWNLCKEITRKKYGSECYTCGVKGLVGSNWHTGHLWPKASLGAYMKYDLRVLRPQCYACNIHRGGEGARFYQRMLKEQGGDYMMQLEMSKQVTVKALDHYVGLTEKYRELLKEL